MHVELKIIPCLLVLTAHLSPANQWCRQVYCVVQGPTSSGKTSLVAFLAAQTGHTLVRINNHEQTDLQEYLGSYISNETGKLVFREGALVQAVRQGHWLLLDELNLAPSQVLEALNRCGYGRL